MWSNAANYVASQEPIVRIQAESKVISTIKNNKGRSIYLGLFASLLVRIYLRFLFNKLFNNQINTAFSKRRLKRIELLLVLFQILLRITTTNNARLRLQQSHVRIASLSL